MEKFSDDWHEYVDDAQSFVIENIDGVDKVNQQWSEISNLVDGGSLDNLAMIDGVQQVLTEEQDASFRLLLEEAEKVPYELMPEYLKAAKEKVDMLRDKIRETEDMLSEKQAKLLEQKQLLETIAPSAAQKLDAITAEETNKIKNSELAELKRKLNAAEVDLEFANDLFEKTGKAWPIPMLVDVKYEPDENDIFTVDQFPNERESISDRIVEKVTRKVEGRLHDASTLLALLLKEKPGHIWLGEELGEAIYEDGGEDKNRDIRRIGNLISDFRRGKVSTMSEEFGTDLILQRGKRQSYDTKTNKRIPSTTRVVWRLVDIETATNAQAVVTTSNDRLTRERYDEWEPANFHEIKLSQLPSGNYDGKTIKDEVVETQVEEVKEAAEKADWRDVFIVTVHETIESMKSRSMLDQPEITWRLMSMLSESAKAGTKEMRERAVKNKIVKRSQIADNDKISASQAVMAMLQNSQPDVFRAASRRKEAVAIVEEILAGYFKAYEGDAQG